MFFFAIYSYSRYKKTNNMTNLYLASMSFCGAMSQAAYGIPALFTSSNQTLSFFAFVGDSFMTGALLLAWLLCTRAYFSSKPKIMLVINIVLSLIAIATIVASGLNNLQASFFSTSLVKINETSSDIVFKDSMLFIVLNGLMSLSLFILTYYFWKQGGTAPTKSQRFRIKSLALSFFCLALVFVVMPAVPFSDYVELRSVTLSFAFIIIAVAGLFGFKTRNKAKN